MRQNLPVTQRERTFTDAERRAPPPVGAQVTFVYRELTRDGVPRFASYWRRREAF